MPATRKNHGATSRRLDGKVAIITASTDGIGFAIAERLAEDGAKVVISSRKDENVKRAVEQLTKAGHTDVLGLKCHVANRDDRQKLFAETVKRFGGLDILVSNAAVNPFFGRALDCTEEMWDKIFDTNLKSSFLLAKEAKPLMQQRGGGNIVFMSSISGVQSVGFIGGYSVSKTALIALTKIAADDVAVDNIRVNCVAPGFIRTRFSKNYSETESGKKAQTTILMRRMGEVEEVSGVVSFLVSDDASYITGETIIPAGGMPARL